MKIYKVEVCKKYDDFGDGGIIPIMEKYFLHLKDAKECMEDKKEDVWKYIAGLDECERKRFEIVHKGDECFLYEDGEDTYCTFYDDEFRFGMDDWYNGQYITITEIEVEE